MTERERRCSNFVPWHFSPRLMFLLHRQSFMSPSPFCGSGFCHSDKRSSLAVLSKLNRKCRITWCSFWENIYSKWSSYRLNFFSKGSFKLSRNQNKVLSKDLSFLRSRWNDLRKSTLLFLPVAACSDQKFVGIKAARKNSVSSINC